MGRTSEFLKGVEKEATITNIFFSHFSHRWLGNITCITVENRGISFRKFVIDFALVYGRLWSFPKRSVKLDNVAIAMHCNLRQPNAASVPIRFNLVAHAKFEVAQPIRCCLIPFLLPIRYVTLWPWTFTSWPWPWTFVVCRLCHSQTLYQIWAQSSNPRRSYCSLNIWPYNLEHVPLCCTMLWDSLHKV